MPVLTGIFILNLTLIPVICIFTYQINQKGITVIVTTANKLSDIISTISSSNKRIKFQKLARKVYDMLDFSWDYNCWSFTSLLFGWTNRIIWLKDKTIEKYLEKYTEPFHEDKTKVKVGDIVVFYDDDIIQHTGVIYRTFKNKKPSLYLVLHKPGSGCISVESISGIKNRYTYGNKVQFYRVK